MEIRKGTREDLEGVIQLLQQVRENMERKDWFYLDPPEEVRELMEEGRMELWVAMDGSRMAGALSVVYPGLGAHNYGYDLDMEADALMKVVCMESAAVHPDYRGMGIQKLLLERAEAQLTGNGERYLMGTIHPENVFSLNNALKQGDQICRTIEKYGSVRHLVCKKIF